MRWLSKKQQHEIRLKSPLPFSKKTEGSSPKSPLPKIKKLKTLTKWQTRQKKKAAKKARRAARKTRTIRCKDSSGRVIICKGPVKGAFKKIMKERAALLNINVPKSEQWFRKRFDLYKVSSDRYNVPFEWCIPDVANHVFKYVIEVDGSFHERPEQKKRDADKDAFYRKRGYRVFRILAYNEEQLDSLIEEIQKIRRPKPKKMVMIRQKDVAS